MTTITLRGTKGSPLTNAEVDANFNNLNLYKVEQDASGNVTVGGNLSATYGFFGINQYGQGLASVGDISVYKWGMAGVSGSTPSSVHLGPWAGSGYPNYETSLIADTSNGFGIKGPSFGSTPIYKGHCDGNSKWRFGPNADQVTPVANLTAFGSGSDAPFGFLPGSLLPSAPASTMEFDGACFYATPKAGQRGIIPSEQFIMLTSNYTLTAQTAAQKLFGKDPSGNTIAGALTLAAGVYEFECVFAIGSLSANFGFSLFSPPTVGATFTQAWFSNAKAGAALNAVANSQDIYSTTAITSLTTTGGTAGIALIKGSITVTTAGQVVPSVSLTTAAAASIIQAGSYFKIKPLNTFIGNWS